MIIAKISGLFPAVLMGVQSVNYDYSLTEADEGYSTFYSRFYLTLSVFFLFNLTDTIGRMSSEYFTRPKSALNIIKPHQVSRNKKISECFFISKRFHPILFSA